MAIIIDMFKGEIPKISDKLLPREHAASAVNCDFESGNLQPIKGVTSVQDLEADTQTIFKLSTSFLEWNSIVSVVKALVADSDDRILYSGAGYPKESNATLALSGSPPFPTTTRRLGIPAPTNALTVTLNGTAGADIVHSSSYVYTIVGLWVDGSVVESAPSAPTAVFDVYEDITPRLTGFIDATATGVFTTHFRIYRLNSGNTGAEYQYVDEILITETQYDDSKTDDDLGEVLPTTNWDGPEETLDGIIATSHGMVFGFKGNTIYPSETFISYAFPAIYSFVTESEIVGFGYTGSLVVVLTNTVPYMVIGQNPGTLALKRLGYQQKCVSARSIVNYPGGIVYASPDGLFAVNEAGTGSLLTKGIFKKEQWEALSPENLFGFYYDESYLGFFAGTTNGFSLNLETGEYKSFTMAENVYGGHYSPDDDLIYLIQTKDAVREIVSWKTAVVQDYTWHSKIFSSVSKYTAGKIQGDFTEGNVNLEFYVDGISIGSKTISSKAFFRLPNSKKGETFQIRATGKAKIDKLFIGLSIPDIAKVL